MSAYDVIYMLKPKCEDLKRGGKGWWRLQWRPIWRQTISAYGSSRSIYGLGIRCWESDARNGWNRWYKHRFAEITFVKWTFTVWIRYDFIVHKDGPSDMGFPKPLVLP